ncbi:FliI/YscN family ATPase [Thioclava sp. A2]|uniref:FliI/YscN family ATPase n=1 Tax=Thioclava sp. FCG-A2 TaxID=3080562 RepID=UPI00295306E3|nr:FliI/YscN family ATPase [Thioclava sp. A2]MDV7270619.1 FliI/YscN family ATPase [Thioclava sp. A2]
MAELNFDHLQAEISSFGSTQSIGRIHAISSGTIDVSGLSSCAALGDRARIHLVSGRHIEAEVLALKQDKITLLPDGSFEGVAIGNRVELLGQAGIAPDNSWIGRIVDPFGHPLDNHPLMRGTHERELRSPPPAAALRKRLGERLETGMAAFNTLLPLVRGQRIGLFAGSGVGKSSLLAKFARGVAADVVVIALIGERGRELREFVEEVLGDAGMKRSVIVAATSDQSPLVRRRCAWSAMAVAEHFRDQGKQVLFLADSITRFAEAHREVALSGGESASLRGYPPSLSQQIMALAERAGPGLDDAGDITAVFSVLVAGSDMEEPVADILRGVLDGHVVLDRQIAERGRFPAVDLLRSVSRSLPAAASAAENAMIGQARKYLGAYARAEMMVQAGLYSTGSDPLIDAAINVWPDLDAFIAEDEEQDTENSFKRLFDVLSKAQPQRA